jgi:adenylate cyclase
MLFLVILASNLSGSVFNFLYNTFLIVHRYLDAHQRAVFADVGLPAYNLVAYGLGLGLVAYLFWPLSRCRRDLLAGRPVAPGRLEACRRRLVRMPLYALGISLLSWLPGTIFFPLLVCGLGGMNAAKEIWLHFGVSFVVSTLLTTAQTFFLVEMFQIHYLYRDFFQDARPADFKGGVSLGWRLALLWLAVAVAPLSALLAVAWNLIQKGGGQEGLWLLAVGVTVVGCASGGLVFWIVGLDLLSWLRLHQRAVRQIHLEDFDHRILMKRPDEFGQLTDAFNEMTAKQARAQVLRETFGQIVHPEVRDELLERFTGLGGEVREITVLFADIRHFTWRSAGEPPERVVGLLNRFLTVAVTAIEEQGGLVNKFLGDGFMALFNAARLRTDHADLAVAAAQELLKRLEVLNQDLVRQGQAPLVIGVGMHTGPALVGCIGATVAQDDGKQRMRKEFTAIGETINLGQRLEQLTKTCGGPVLLSAQTRARLQRTVTLFAMGTHRVPGYANPLVVYRLGSE